MNHTETFNCASCQAENEKGSVECSSCKKSLTVATLKSLGTGSVPKDFIWPIYPCDMTIGSSTSNDIILPSNRVAKKHCRFVYRDGSILIDRPDRTNVVLINGNNIQAGVVQKINEGANIKIGLDEFSLMYHNISHIDLNLKTEAEKVQRKLDHRQAVNPVASRLLLVLGYLQELHASMDVNDLLSNSVDAVLKLTGLDRGYAFIVEYVNNEMNLKKITSRKVGGFDFFEEDYTISRTMLSQVAQNKDSVIIEDVDSDSLSTKSMRELKIKSLVCMPLSKMNPKTQQMDLLGVIYADKIGATTELPKQIRSTLQTLAQLVVANLDRCQKFNETQYMCSQYEEYLKNLAKEIDIIGNNLEIIAENMATTSSIDDFQSMYQYISAEHLKLTSIIRNVLAATE